MQQGTVVFQQCVEIQRVELRNDTVNELASQVTAFVDEVAVVGRNHHQRKLADMLAQAVVLLFVETERLFRVAFLHTRHQLIILLGMAVDAMYREEILLMTDVLLVGSTEKTLAKRKVINRVEDVGLSGTIKSHKTIDVLRKQQIGRFAVLEIRQFQFVEKHIIFN